MGTKMHGNVTREDIKRAKLGVPISIQEQEQARLAASEENRKEIAARASSLGMKRRRVMIDGKPLYIWTYQNSFHAMGFNAFQIAAAERFDADWQAAYRGLRGQGFEPGVDHARSQHGPHLSIVDAQGRLQSIRAKLGDRSWNIVVAVVIYGATAREIHRWGGAHHRMVHDDMKTAFNDLDAFYTGSLRKDRTWTAIEKFNSERAQMLIAAEGEAR